MVIGLILIVFAALVVGGLLAGARGGSPARRTRSRGSRSSDGRREQLVGGGRRFVLQRTPLEPLLRWRLVLRRRVVLRGRGRRRRMRWRQLTRGS
ncbi:hypothetical protein [Streptomyces plicatus]|uniref:Secreted protein n=1 Tax=Streptomyces plicatus TaxID=1922 RepID=A0ABW1Y1E8_STRPL